MTTRPARGAAIALGSDPKGVYDLTATTPIHWSAKAGNALVRTTATDEARWVRQLFHGHFLREASRAAIVDSAGVPYGYGWFRRPNKRFGEFAYSMSGRSPGFASHVILSAAGGCHRGRAQQHLLVGDERHRARHRRDRGRSTYEPVALRNSRAVPDTLALDGAHFTFPADFYQPNATLAFEIENGEMFMRWPSTIAHRSSRSTAITRSTGRIGSRSSFSRDTTGRAVAMSFDRFRGERAAGDSLPPH